MKYLMREYKGTYQYIKKQTITELIKTFLLFAMAFGIYFIGLINLGTNKSLWSIIAVLGLLPASKSLVGLIMLLRYRSLNADLYAELAAASKEHDVLFENVLTTSKKSYFVPVIFCLNNNLIGYCENSKDSNKELTAHINNVLNNALIKGITVKIFNTKEEYLQRAVNMCEHFEDSDFNPKVIYSNIKAVSL